MTELRSTPPSDLQGSRDAELEARHRAGTFAPHHEQAARELVRVCRTGGRITPDRARLELEYLLAVGTRA
jgi:hypothetical protein